MTERLEQLIAEKQTHQAILQAHQAALDDLYQFAPPRIARELERRQEQTKNHEDIERVKQLESQVKIRRTLLEDYREIPETDHESIIDWLLSHFDHRRINRLIKVTWPGRRETRRILAEGWQVFCSQIENELSSLETELIGLQTILERQKAKNDLMVENWVNSILG